MTTKNCRSIRVLNFWKVTRWKKPYKSVSIVCVALKFDVCWIEDPPSAVTREPTTRVAPTDSTLASSLDQCGPGYILLLSCSTLLTGMPQMYLWLV